MKGNCNEALAKFVRRTYDLGGGRPVPVISLRRHGLRRPFVGGWSEPRLDSFHECGAPSTSSAGQNPEALPRPLHVLCAGWTCRNRRFPLMLVQEPKGPGRKGGDNGGATPALETTPNELQPRPRERIYVGIDIGYREHVAAASPLAVFNVGRRPDGWKRVKPIHFASDANGLARFQRYLDHHSPHAGDFLILLEPTGS